MPSEPFHRLFFAVRPAAGVRRAIAGWRDSLGQTKGLVADDQLHLTAWLFDDRQDFPADAAARAQAAIADVPLASFRLVLDRMVGGAGSVVLVPSAVPPGLLALQGALDRALRAGGLQPRCTWSFRPHVTLLHGRHTVDRDIPPIDWPVEELLLLDSIVGERRHETVARWPLG